MNENYINFLQKKLNTYYDTKENLEYENLKFDLFAKYNQINSKYVGLKSISVYEYRNNEFLYIKNSKNFDMDEFNNIVEIFKKNLNSLIDKDNNHMSSLISFIFLVEDMDESLFKNIKKFSYSKSFSFGFKGWVDFGVSVINIKNRYIVNNKKTKVYKELFNMDKNYKFI
ncbi:MAG: hypothetical protein N4A54_10425 [Peptostreptococcaceae bacterium]|jgi:hypothetical protein|nr:hypothetical protein [Peptostreptococcaceae bacterium]